MEELFAKIETEGFSLNDLTPTELLQLLDNQIQNLLYLSENVDQIDLQKLVPRQLESTNEEEVIEVGLKVNSRLKSNFVEEPNGLNSRKSALIKKFYLKQAPSLTISDYLQRIFKHCSLSTSLILTCCLYLFNIMLGIYYDKHQFNYTDLQLIPFNNLNLYRIILTSMRVALKFIEDKNFKIRYYCKIVGLNVKDYATLELNFLFLIDFKFFINDHVMSDTLKLIRRLDKFLKDPLH